MTRGTRPKPTKLKKLVGNPCCRPLNEQEPKYKVAGVAVHPVRIGSYCWDLIIGIGGPEEVALKGYVDYVQVGEIAPTDTIATLASATPIASTPTEASPSDTDMALYDDFNNAEFNGSYNKLNWLRDDDRCHIVQQDGILKLEHSIEPKEDCNLYALKYWDVTLWKPTFYEVMMMLDAEDNAGVVGIKINAELEGTRGWWTECHINFWSGPDIATAGCYYDSFAMVPEEYYYIWRSRLVCAGEN